MTNIDLPDFVQASSRQRVQEELLRIRASRLRDGDLTAALEAIVDLMMKEFEAGGRVATEESVNRELADATVSLATQIDLHKTNPGPYTGESAIYRGGVKVAGATGPDFDFRIRLRKKLNLMLAQVLERQADQFRKRPATDSTSSAGKSELIKDRSELLESYKRRVINKENGKPFSDYALYTAKGHSMYKPQFYEWKNGTLPAGNPASVNFERFLKGNAPPIPRKSKS